MTTPIIKCPAGYAIGYVPIDAKGDVLAFMHNITKKIGTYEIVDTTRLDKKYKAKTAKERRENKKSPP